MALKIKKREKRFLIVGGIIVFCIFAYQFATWYSSMKSTANEYIETREVTLQKQIEKIQQKTKFKNNLEALDIEVKELEKRIVPGDTPAVAAAEIQRNLKAIALSVGIEIKSEKALSSVDSGFYLSIPVEIGFTAQTAKLKDMLYRIKTSPLLLTVPKVKIRVLNVNNPGDIYATVTVEGFIRKPEQEQGKQVNITHIRKGNNAA